MKTALLSLLLLFSALPSLMAQGCSDAGFCTMGAMRPDQKYSKTANLRLRSVEASHYYGYTKFKDIITSVTVDFNFSIGKKGGAQIKLPYQFVHGPLANTRGLSDFSISFTRNLYYSENWQVNATIGGKIPTGKPNKSIEGRPLPMYYQTTLGTYDIVAGISAQNRKWLLAMGYQQALNKVENEFLWGPWENYKDTDFFENVVKPYPIAKDLLRGKDVMCRVERNFRFSRFNISLGTLHIYRLTPDRVVNRTGEKIKEADTTGMAWTMLLGGGYRITPHSGIKFMLGRKITTRYKNADGLSREFVNTIGYELKF